MDMRGVLLCVALLVCAQPVWSQATSGPLGSITVQIPNPNALSGNVTITATITKNDSSTNFYYYLLDGSQIKFVVVLPPVYAPTFDTTNWSNGVHTLYIWAHSGAAPYLGYGTWRQSVTVNNPKTLLELRANYRELFLMPGETASLRAFAVYTTGEKEPIASPVFSSENASIASVSPGGIVTAERVGDVFLNVTASGKTTRVWVVVNSFRGTPHFGSDGSRLLEYDPARSLFVRSMFHLTGNLVDLLTKKPEYIADFHSAGVNALETGFYPVPSSSQTFEQWSTAFNAQWSGIESTARTQDFQLLLTGDNIARGSPAVYATIKGPGSNWTPHPLEYALEKVRDSRRAVGIEMVDEISFSFHQPYPEGRIGVPGGPINVTCIADLCTAQWNAQYHPGNGARRMIITGAISDPDLNRPITQYYLYRSNNSNTIEFNATNVGTRVFTPASDPNLIVEMLAAVPVGPNGTDYLRSDSFLDIMNIMNRVPGRTPITWPVAGDHSAFTVSKWLGDARFSDYATLYYTLASRSYPVVECCTLPDLLNNLNRNLYSKNSAVQRDKPVLWLTSIAGSMYRILGEPKPIISVVDDTITFSEPHGVTVISNQTRLSIENASSPGVNGKYRLFSIPDAFTLRIFRDAPSTFLSSSAGGMAVFEDSSSQAIRSVEFVFYKTGLIYFPFSSNCSTFSNRVGQYVTVSGTADARYNNIKWLIRDESCTWRSLQVEEAAVGNASGGVAFVVKDNLLSGPDAIMIGGMPTALVSANIAWAAANGGAGVRAYHFLDNVQDAPAVTKLFHGEPKTGDGIQIGSNPRYNGPDSVARWTAMRNANNLIERIEPYLLQPKMHAPDYGRYIVTAARTSSYGKMLMLISFSEVPITERIDLLEYFSGTPGTMHRMSATSLTADPFSGTETTVTFQPGETVVFLFPLGSNTTNPIPRRIVIDLEGPLNKTASGTLTLLDSISHTVLYQSLFTTDSMGVYNFTLSSAFAARADVRVSLPGYLSRIFPSVDVTSSSLLVFTIPQLLAGDFNGDGAVNSLDWSTMNRNWFSFHALADINRDGVVNSLDFSFLSKNWLRRGD